MKTFLALPMLLVFILLACLFDSPSNAQNKSDQFEMPVASTAPGAGEAQSKAEVDKLPTLYILSIEGCAPCERFRNEIIARTDHARWLLNHHKVLLIKIKGFPSVMYGNGEQFIWPDGCWKADASPLKALTSHLGYKKEKDKVGIRDLMKANDDLVLSEASGVSQAVVCTPPTGAPINTYGDFLEDDQEELQIDQNSEAQPRTAIVDLPRVVDGSAFICEEGWKFVIDGETWSFNGFKGRDANTQTILLTMSGVNHNTGRLRF